MKNGLMAMLLAVLCMVNSAVAEVAVTSVKAQQWYHWNGKVDIEVQLSGTAEELAGYEVVFAATNVATQAELATEHIEKVGEDIGSGTSWTRKFL